MELSQSPYISVDLEHNSARSYQGMTCLIQISDSKNDFIVDPLILGNHIMRLN